VSKAVKEVPAERRSSLTPSNLTLKELRHVSLLQQTLSFNRAAELAGITQSALSQSIANIEQRLDIVLFDRSRRSVSGTVFSDFIAQQAEAVISTVDEMDAHIEALRDTREGTVSFGMGIFAANHLLNPVMQRFYQRYPEIHLRTTVAHIDQLQDELLRGDMDFFVGAVDPRFREGSPVREHLYKEELVVACRPEHPLVGASDVGARDLIRYPAVSYDGAYLRRQIYRHLTNTQEFELLERNVTAVMVQQPWLLAEFVEVSDHVILASKSALQEILHSGRLVTVEITDLNMDVDVELVSRPSARSLPAISRLIETVREVVAGQQLS
jgi:DNA-binding transcriptional LysR family regulator